MPLRLLSTVLDWPRLTLLIGLLLSALAALGVTRLSVTTDLRIYFSDDNPQLAALEELERKYRENDSLFFVVVADDQIVSNPCLAVIETLTMQGWLIPHAFRSSSLSNYRVTRSQGDALVTRTIAELAANTSLVELQQVIANEPALRHGLLSVDGTVSGVAVLLALPDDDTSAVERVVNEARKLLRNTDSRSCGKILLAGSATNSMALGEAIRSDLQTLVVLSYLAIAAGLLLLLRSLSITVLVMAIISVSVVVTMGIFGWLGFVLSPTAGFVPSIVLTIAVADCVHIISNYLIEIGRDPRHRQAIAESLRINIGPVTLTSVTTAIGMLTLNLSDSPPYRDLGNMVAVGVGVAYLLSLTMLPAALRLLPPLRAPGYALSLPAEQFTGWLVRRRHRLLLSGALVVLVIAAFIPRNHLTEYWHQYFTEHYEIRRAVDVIDARLGGIHRLYYDLESGRSDGVTRQEYLQQLDAFASWFEQQPGVGFASGLHTTLKNLNRALNGNQADFYRLPQSDAASAQFLLLYELSLPIGESLSSLIDQDRSASRLIVSVHKTDSEQLLALDRRATQWLQTHAPAMQARPGTGLDLVFAHITHRNIRGLLAGTAIALLTISILLALALRSLRLGLISLLPNLAPATLAYGLWGMAVGYVDLALSVVMCMSLGIVVDDTVHFMSKYNRARREHGLDAVGGILHAFRTVGLALVVTSVVLVVGFGVLAFSNFNPTRETGTLLALTIALALLVDFLLLPPLLLLADRRKTGQEEPSSGQPAA